MSYSPFPQRYSQSYQTTNATPVVVFSTPVSASSAEDIVVEFDVTRSDFGAAGFGEIRAVFRRTSGGNIVRATGNTGILGGILSFVGDFVGPAPSVNLIANTVDQTADVQLTGLSGATLDWTFTVIVRRNT